VGLTPKTSNSKYERKLHKHFGFISDSLWLGAI